MEQSKKTRIKRMTTRVKTQIGKFYREEFGEEDLIFSSRRSVMLSASGIYGGFPTSVLKTEEVSLFVLSY